MKPKAPGQRDFSGHYIFAAAISPGLSATHAAVDARISFREKSPSIVQKKPDRVGRWSIWRNHAVANLTGFGESGRGMSNFCWMAAPALMSFASTASLVMEVVDGAYALADSAMDEAEVPTFARRKAA